MIVGHEEEQDGAIEALGFVEFEFGDGEVVGVADGIVGDLAVFVGEDADIGCAFADHLEGGFDDVDHGFRGVVFHGEGKEVFALEGFDDGGAVGFEVGEGAGDCNSEYGRWCFHLGFRVTEVRYFGGRRSRLSSMAVRRMFTPAMSVEMGKFSTVT